MDDDVKAAFDELRAEIKDASRARTPSVQREGDRHVREAREDLEDVLRREGYRLSRRELDRLVDEDEDRRFNERLDKALAARVAAESEEEEEELDADGNPTGKKKPAAKKPATKKPAAAKPEEEEWV